MSRVHNKVRLECPIGHHT